MDLENALWEATHYSAILGAMLDDLLATRRAEDVNEDGSHLRLLMSREEIDRACFIWNKAIAASRDVKDQFYRIAHEGTAR